MSRFRFLAGLVVTFSLGGLLAVSLPENVRHHVPPLGWNANVARCTRCGRPTPTGAVVIFRDDGREAFTGCGECLCSTLDAGLALVGSHS